MTPRQLPAIPLLLLFLAFVDLQSEIRLLIDRFTFTSLIVAIQSHLLAVAILVLMPSLWRMYQRNP